MKKCKCRTSPHIVVEENEYDTFNLDYVDMCCPKCGTWFVVNVPEHIPGTQEVRWMKLLEESLK